MTDEIIKRAEGWLEKQEYNDGFSKAADIIRDLLTALKGKGWQKVAHDIREALLDDITDRRGWRQEWNGFDDDIQEEIKATFDDIILSKLPTSEEK
jgi:hypothetical protein